ncbi:formate/nitrite transporter FocA (FNT family) [Paraburkholderia sp. MM5477-R1]
MTAARVRLAVQCLNAHALHQSADVLRPTLIASRLSSAIFAGWLIALMVWLLPSARSGRLFAVLLITYVVAAARLSHIIAGSTEVAYAYLSGCASLYDYPGPFRSADAGGQCDRRDIAGRASQPRGDRAGN